MCHLIFHVLELQNIRSRTSPARHWTWRSYVRPLVSETARLHPALDFAMLVLVTQVWVCQPRCAAHQLRPGRHQHPPQHRLLHRLRSYSTTSESCFSPLTLCSTATGKYQGRIVSLRDANGNISATIIDGLTDGFEIYTDSNHSLVCTACVHALLCT